MIGGDSRPTNSCRTVSDLPRSTKIGAGEQGLQPSDLPAGNPRPRDPEAGVFDQVRLGLLDEFCGRNDAL